MINTQKAFAAATILAAAGTTFAQVTPGTFSPTQTDDYESYGGGRTPITAVFGGTVPIIAGSVDHRSVDFGDWQDFRAPGGPVTPTSGSRFGVQFGFGDFTYDFTGIGGVFGFSFSATAAGVGSDTIEIFDMSGTPIGSFTDADGWGPGDGSMEDLSFVSTVAIGSARVTGRETCFDDIAIIGDPPVPCQDWTPFTWGGLGDVVTVPVEVTDSCRFIKVTDAFLSGNEFSVRVLDGATEIAAFDTSETTLEGDDIGSDYDGAFADERWSSGSVEVGTPGNYTVEITVTRDPFGGGGAAVEVATSVPPPPPPPCPVVEGDFDGEALEDYEGTGGGRTFLSSLFGGDVDVLDGAVGHTAVDAGDWLDFRAPGGPIQPTSGSIFGTLFGFGDITLDFTGSGGITGFKGNASAAGVGDDVVTFFDLDGNELCSFTTAGGFGPGDGSMVSFSYVSDSPIGSVRLDGPETAFDDLEYATAVGCAADIDGDGVLTIFDFLAFQTLFSDGDLAADFDGDGILTIFDFLEFQTQFDAGCD
ncbi:MAG: GC-type dockerin domain-anchored protein [Phycisphaerales bacterium]